jgi:ferredoxin-NADP reductase
MTEPEKSAIPWQGEVGYIDRTMLEKYLSDISLHIYYLSGPPAMVEAMRTLLNKAGVDDDTIKSEEFSGY